MKTGGSRVRGPAIPPMYQLAHLSWRKLKSAFRVRPPARPAGVSELAPEPPVDPHLRAAHASAGSEEATCRI